MAPSHLLHTNPHKHCTGNMNCYQVVVTGSFQTGCSMLSYRKDCTKEQLIVYMKSVITVFSDKSSITSNLQVCYCNLQLLCGNWMLPTSATTDLNFKFRQVGKLRSSAQYYNQWKGNSENKRWQWRDYLHPAVTFTLSRGECLHAAGLPKEVRPAI